MTVPADPPLPDLPPPDQPSGDAAARAEDIRQTAPDDDLDRQLARLMRHSRRYIWAALGCLTVAVIGLVAAVLYLVAAYQGTATANTRHIAANQASSDHRWCATLGLLTRVPVTPPAEPAANQSREASYELYENLITLKRQFHCP